MNYDVIIVGGGVVGSATARALAQYHVRVAVLEKTGDVCCGNSGRNTGLLHAGFFYAPGTHKAKFCVEGNREHDQIAAELDLPLKRTGKLTVGSTDAERRRLEILAENGVKNGVPGIHIIEREELRAIEPNVTGEFAMVTPTSAIISPYLYAIALAENAAVNGVDYYLEHELIASERLPGGSYRLTTSKGTFEAKWVINSSGYNADVVAEILGTPGYRLSNSKGEYQVLDTKMGAYLSIPVYITPDENWMYDVHVTPTIDGNVLVGPTILGEKAARGEFDTTPGGQRHLNHIGHGLFPPMNSGHVIRSFAGIFPNNGGAPMTASDDYILDVREKENLIHLVGIGSPGLTSASSLGQWVAMQIDQREHLTKNVAFNPIRKGIVPFSQQGHETQRRMIDENPDYGEIICRCECITKAEIVEALNNPLGVTNVTGIKYRTRASMGRCQGGYCEMRITALIRQLTDAKVTDVRYTGRMSYMFTGEVRTR